MSKFKSAILVGVATITLFSSLHAADPLTHMETSGQQFTNLDLINKYNSERFNRQIYNSLRYYIEPCTCYPDLSFIQPWFQIETGWNHSNGERNSVSPFKNETLDFSLGAHMPYGGSSLLGFAASYNGNNLKFSHGAGTCTLNTWQGAAYTVIQNPYCYFLGDVIIAANEGHSHRRIQYNLIDTIAQGSPSSNYGMVYTEFGINNNVYHALIQPFIAFEFGWNKRHKISEKNELSYNLDIAARTSKIFDLYVGSHFTTMIGKTVAVSADVAWHHRYGPNSFNVSTRFPSGGPCAFVKGAEVGKDALEGTVNIAATFCNNLSLFAALSGERWSNFSAFSLDLGFSFWW